MSNPETIKCPGANGRCRRRFERIVQYAFVYTDYDGTIMNKAEFLADLKDPEYHASLVANESVRVISYPNVAIVVGTYHTKGKYKRQAFEHYGRFTRYLG